ncbi:Uncharacterised protein [uncultured archaeon]|nr:Uncharacterised protein [uncultured archaeon]
MKKGVALLFISLVISSFLIGSVSAETGFSSVGEKVKTFMDGGLAAIGPIITPIIGETTDSPYFFAKILFFIIILSIVWLALSRVEIFYEYVVVLWTVSIAVSILAVKYMSDAQWLMTMLLPYEALGVTISAGLPFAVYFFIVNIGMQGPKYKTVRSVAWIFFGVIFIGLWFTRYDLGDATYVYPVTALACLLMIIFDGTLQRFFYKMKLDRYSARDDGRQIVIEKMVRNDNLLANGAITPAEHAATKKRLAKQMVALNR